MKILLDAAERKAGVDPSATWLLQSPPPAAGGERRLVRTGSTSDWCKVSVPAMDDDGSQRDFKCNKLIGLVLN